MTDLKVDNFVYLKVWGVKQYLIWVQFRETESVPRTLSLSCYTWFAFRAGCTLPFSPSVSGSWPLWYFPRAILSCLHATAGAAEQKSAGRRRELGSFHLPVRGPSAPGTGWALSVQPQPVTQLPDATAVRCCFFPLLRSPTDSSPNCSLIKLCQPIP